MRKTDNQSKRVIDNNDSDIEDGHDSDKDPDYHKSISVNGMYTFCYIICVLHYNIYFKQVHIHFFC